MQPPPLDDDPEVGAAGRGWRMGPPAGQADRVGSLRAMLRNAGWLLSGKGVGALLSLVYLGLATRTLGPDRFGELMLILGLGQAVSAIAGFQSWQIVIQYGIGHLRRGDTVRLDRLTLFASMLDLVAAAVGGAGAWIAITAIGPHMGWSDEISRRALLFCLVLLFSLRSAPTGLLRLHDRYAVATLAETVTPVVRLAGALIVVLAGASVPGFLAAWAVAEIATGVAYWLFAIGYAGFPWRVRRWPSLAGVADDNPGLWRYAGATNVMGSLAVSSRQLSVVVVGLFVSAGAAGAFRLCYQLAQAVAKASQMVSRALFPELVRAHGQDGAPAFAAMVRRTATISLIAGGVLLLVVWTAGGTLLGLIAGHAYRGQMPLLRLVGTAAAIDLAGMSFEPVLFSARRERTAFAVRAVAVVLLFGTMILLVPAIGVAGAGWACIIHSAAAFIGLGLAATRTVRVSGAAEPRRG